MSFLLASSSFKPRGSTCCSGRTESGRHSLLCKLVSVLVRVRDCISWEVSVETEAEGKKRHSPSQRPKEVLEALMATDKLQALGTDFK